MNNINNKIKRLDPSIIETAKKFTSATLHEAFKKGRTIDRSIKPIDAGIVLYTAQHLPFLLRQAIISGYIQHSLWLNLVMSLLLQRMRFRISAIGVK